MPNPDYYEQNKEKLKARAREHYYKNKEHKLELAKKHYEENKEDKKKYRKEYYKNNKEKELSRSKEYQREWYKKKYHNDPNFAIRKNLGSRLSKAFRGISAKSKTTMELLGCSIEELIKHLESKFEEGMTMANYGEWHIDHIKPCAAFDLTKEEEQKKCFHYTNLQPLWAIDNIKKSDKYDAPKAY